LSQFSRRARWLNQVFPASRAPQTSDPNSVSDDVSLTQPYDGSGWAIPDSSQWIIQLDSALAASGQVILLAVPEGFVYRLFGAHSFRVTGSTGTSSIAVRDLVSVPNTAVLLAPQLDIAGDPKAFEINRAVVVPAGLTITGDFFNGSPTIAAYRMYGCLVPAGTVFYC